MSQRTDSETTIQVNLDYRHLKYFVGLFFLAGAGVGLTGVLSMVYVSGGGPGGSITAGFFFILTLIIAFSVGPILGLILSNDFATRYPVGDRPYVSAFVGGMAGYFVMVLTVAIILLVGMGLLLAGGGDPAGPPDGTTGAQDGTTAGNPLNTFLELIGPMILFSIPTGLICAGTIYMNERGVLPDAAVVPPSSAPTADQPPSDTPPAVDTPDEDIADRPSTAPQFILDHFRITRGLPLGILAALIVTALVVGIIAIEPFGEAEVPLVPPYTPVNVLKIYSWFILMAHGVAVEGFTLEVTRSFLLESAPIVGMAIAGWIGGRLWGENTYLTSTLAGTSTAIGYVVFIAAAAIIAPTAVDPTAPNINGNMIQVDFLSTVITVGIVYPFVVGGIGGMIANYGGSE